MHCLSCIIVPQQGMSPGSSSSTAGSSGCVSAHEGEGLAVLRLGLVPARRCLCWFCSDIVLLPRALWLRSHRVFSLAAGTLFFALSARPFPSGRAAARGIAEDRLHRGWGSRWRRSPIQTKLSLFKPCIRQLFEINEFFTGSAPGVGGFFLCRKRIVGSKIRFFFFLSTAACIAPLPGRIAHQGVVRLCPVGPPRPGRSRHPGPHPPHLRSRPGVPRACALSARRGGALLRAAGGRWRGRFRPFPGGGGGGGAACS